MFVHTTYCFLSFLCGLSFLYVVGCDSNSVFVYSYMCLICFTPSGSAGGSRLTGGRSPGAFPPSEGFPLWVGPSGLDILVRVSALGRPAPYPPLNPCVVVLLNYILVFLLSLLC